MSQFRAYGPDDNCYMLCENIPLKEKLINQEKEHWSGCPTVESSGKLENSISVNIETECDKPENDTVDETREGSGRSSCIWCHRRGFGHYEPIDPCSPPNITYPKQDDSLDWIFNNSGENETLIEDENATTTEILPTELNRVELATEASYIEDLGGPAHQSDLPELPKQTETLSVQKEIMDTPNYPESVISPENHDFDEYRENYDYQGDDVKDSSYFSFSKYQDEDELPKDSKYGYYVPYTKRKEEPSSHRKSYFDHIWYPYENDYYYKSYTRKGLRRAKKSANLVSSSSSKSSASSILASRRLWPARSILEYKLSITRLFLCNSIGGWHYFLAFAGFSIGWFALTVYGLFGPPQSTIFVRPITLFVLLVFFAVLPFLLNQFDWHGSNFSLRIENLPSVKGYT